MNFLMIVSDQHRADAVGYLPGSDVNTPNLNCLAAEGTVLDRAYTPLPVCTPARQAILTGLDPNSYGCFWNPGFFPAANPPEQAYWPEQLRLKGYDTAFFGKWGATTDSPLQWGYSEYCSYDAWHNYIKEKYGRQPDADWFGCTSPIPAEDAQTHWITQQAARAIRSKKGKNWHIRVDFTVPHLPCVVSEPFASMYDPATVQMWPGCADPLENKPFIQKRQVYNWRNEDVPEEKWRGLVARYKGMISQMDDSLGALFRALRETEQWNDTVILYTADHGDMCGSRKMLDKHYILYDDVVRVPMVITGPGIRHGVLHDFTSLTDIANTVADLFGITVPQNIGRSFAPELQGKTPADPPARFAISSSNGQQFGFFTQRMITDGQWKYIWNLTDIDEFYNLSDDPAELHNLIGSPDIREQLTKMKQDLKISLEKAGDPFIRGGWLNRQLEDGGIV